MRKTSRKTTTRRRSPGRPWRSAWSRWVGLGVLIVLGTLALSSSAVAAIEPPALENLLRDAERTHIHIEIPRLEVPSGVIRQDYGTADPAAIGTLNTERDSEVALGAETTQEITGSHDDDSLTRKCLAGALKQLIQLAAVEETTNVESALVAPLEKCLLERFPELERAQELAEYLSRETTERAKQASEAVPQEPEIFLNWVNSTASTLEETEPSPTPTTTTSPPSPAPDESGSGGVSTGVIVVIVLAVLGVLVYVLNRRK